MTFDKVTPQLDLKTLFTQWPETILVFNQHQMSCVGCSMSPFDTLEDAVLNYHLSLNVFLAELQKTCTGPGRAYASAH